jgi:hypothetical protein
LPIAAEVDDYPICLNAKLHKANKSTSSTRQATQCNQGISINFGFVVQSSKDNERVRRLSGLHGETCYVFLHDHFSNTLYSAALRSKAPPIEWLTKWLANDLLRPGTIRMGLSSFPIETLEIRSVPCSWVPHWHLVFGRIRSIVSGEDSVRTLFWS